MSKILILYNIFYRMIMAKILQRIIEHFKSTRGQLNNSKLYSVRQKKTVRKQVLVL